MAICVCTNLPSVGVRMKELIRRFRHGDREGAHAIGRELEPALDALAVTTNPIPIKAALAMTGRDVGGLRLPLVEATEDERLRIRAGLERAGALARTIA